METNARTTVDTITQAEVPYVKGWGPDEVDIMLVCDYPNKEDLSNGRALSSGTSRRMVNNYLKDAGYDISKCYQTSFIRTALAMPRSKKKQILALQQAREDFKPNTFENALAKEILDVNPNVIISMGELPTNYLVGKRKIDKLRGSVLPLSDICRMDTGDPGKLKPNIRVIPVFSPREVQAKWSRDSYTTLDYAKAVRVRTRMDSISDHSLIWICRDTKSLSTWWFDRGCKSEFLTLDIETYNGFVTCISFCGDGYEALSIPLVDKTISALDRGFMLRLIAKILRSPVPKINQNIKYDHHMLDYWGLYLENVAGDTMLLGHTIYPELPKGLDFYTSIYTDIAYYKDDGRDFNPKQGWDVLYIYNAKDSLSAWQIYKKQELDAKEMGVWDFYKTKVWPCYHVYKKMDDRGILIDEIEKTSLNVKYGEILTLREKNLRELAGKPKLNFNSPKQMQELVYKDLRLPEQRRRNAEGQMVLSTDEETIEELILNHSQNQETRDILWGIIWCRKVYKILSYINTPYHLDCRMRTGSKLTGTKSGRTSMSETVDRIWYRNQPGHPWYREDKKGFKVWSRELGLSFQTIPKHGFDIGETSIGRDIRKMYIPTPGYTFVEGDGGQAEARVVAILAEDYDALDEMERSDFRRNSHKVKDDLHTKTAMLVLSKSFEEITDVIRQDFGKKPRHAGNYDMGPKRLSLMAHISFAKAVACLSRFHSISPRIREIFHTTIRTVVTNTHILSTLHGRTRQFLDKLTEETFKQAYSYIPQAVVSDHTKFDTIVPLMHYWEAIDPKAAYFLSESHDSGFFEVRNDYVEPFSLKFKELEETPLVFNQGTFIRDRQLIIPLEVKISATNWHEMKEIKIS